MIVLGHSEVEFGLKSYDRVIDEIRRIRFVNRKYDYRQNWTTRSPVTN